MNSLKLGTLILMTSVFAQAKGPMLHNKYLAGQNGPSITFVTVDLMGTATRVSECNTHSLCGRSQSAEALCTDRPNEKCTYLTDIVVSKLKFDSQNHTYPWIVEYSYQDGNQNWTPLFTVQSSTTGAGKILVTYAGETQIRSFYPVNPQPENPGVLH